MELTEDKDIKVVKELLQKLIKAKKTLRMYPQGNPIYVKTLEDLYARFRSFFDYQDELTLKIGQNTIVYDSEQIYYNPEKEDNMALFLFKDGIREITFKKELLQEELEEFLKVIVVDFDREKGEMSEDDMVTLLWEKDFQNIQYVVDGTFLMDEIDEDYERKAVTSVKGRGTDVESLQRAYADGLEGMVKDEKKVSIMPPAFEEIQMLGIEMEKDSSDKMEKLITILFEVFSHAEGEDDLEDSIMFLKDIIRFSLTHGDIHTVINALGKAKSILDDSFTTDEAKKYMKMLFVYIGTEEIINLLGALLDSSSGVDEDILKRFTDFLDKDAIVPLVKILGDLKTIRARKSIIETLITIGRKDMQKLAAQLNDSRWYVVRNIVFILRRIGDKRAVDYLLKTMRHRDIRVRKEVIRTLGEMNGQGALQSLSECLDDSNAEVRIASARAIGNIGTDAAKKILIEKVSQKQFKERDFNERKEVYEILSRWKDAEVLDYLTGILKKKSFFGMGRNYEDMACAAFCLGLVGNKEVLPLLYKFSDTNNKLLREFSQIAIKRLELGR